MQWIVVLMKGKHKPSKQWAHTTKNKAIHHAVSLCELHVCDYTVDESLGLITVNASKWYGI